jgi:maltose/moltooligosaccharide transporter
MNTMRLDYKKTILISLGFFTVGVLWSIYNVAVPIFLDELGLAGLMVGIVMAIDNIFGVVFFPLFGSMSDRTRTRFGKRMPYLLVGIPMSALFFILIPLTSKNLFLLMASVIMLNFFMSVYRGPSVALMPDLTPRPLRSKANGIINFAGGVGTAIAFLLGGLLFDVNVFLPFVICAVLMIITIIVMYRNIHEPVSDTTDSDDYLEGTPDEANGTKTGERRSLICMLGAIFFWFTGYNVVETFFSTYGEKILGIDMGMSSYLLLAVSALFLICAIPAGFIGGRFGRKRTILAGLVLMIAVFVMLIFIRNIPIMFILMALGGVSWALININSYPMVVEMTSSKSIGKYTGYYYLFSMSAAIISPILYGGLKDWLGDGLLFVYSTVGLVIALLLMLLVKHGEASAAPQAMDAFEGIEHME